MEVKLIAQTNDPVEVMWTAARTCYNSKSPIEMWENLENNSRQVAWEHRDDEDESKLLEDIRHNTDKRWNLVTKVLDSGHSCYDELTEVLTSEGFKFWKDVTSDDLIAAVHPQTLTMHYEKPIRLIQSEYQGKMYQFDNKYINLCVTPNHRLYTSLINTLADRKSENFNFYTCNSKCYKNIKKGNQETALRPQKFRFSCNTTSQRVYNPFSLEKDKVLAFNKLIGFFIGDGYASEGNRIEFHLKKERKITYLKTLTDILGWELVECKNNKYKVFYKTLGKFARNTYYDTQGKKHIPTEMLLCSTECIKAFVDGLMNSDGFHYNKGSFSFVTTSKNVADTLQALIHIIGGRASLKCIDNSHHESWKDRFKLEINLSDCQKYVLVNDSRHIKKDTQIIEYTGHVYCCEVSTGLLLVRRNAKICLCGNSVAEHVYFTFAIEGISRACSHQLVRHRAGIVFSQQSQRYVEIKESLKDVSDLLYYAKKEAPVAGSSFFGLKEVLDKYFVTPDSISETDMETYFAFGNSLISYLEAIERGSKAEDARNFLPNATKTNITMSVNLRELIHLCNLRLCTRAQKEIRELFELIKAEVINAQPRLAKYLVPTCEINGICYEHQCCGRKPHIGEVMAVYNAFKDDYISKEDYAQIQDSIKNPKINKKLKALMEMSSVIKE